MTGAGSAGPATAAMMASGKIPATAAAITEGMTAADAMSMSAMAARSVIQDMTGADRACAGMTARGPVIICGRESIRARVIFAGMGRTAAPRVRIKILTGPEAPAMTAVSAALLISREGEETKGLKIHPAVMRRGAGARY